MRSPPQCLLFQETRFENRDQVGGFRVHLNSEIGGPASYKLFINDHRSDLDSNAVYRSSGVATFFHQSMPGFADLEHLRHLDVPDRYMVVRTTWDGHPVYFHNIYAPVEPRERAPFFRALPQAPFEDNSVHCVGGDFNLALDATRDAVLHTGTHRQGRTACAEWLSALGVIDPWRLKYPDERVFSGPSARTRLDYIFVDTALAALYHKDSSYDANVYGGDHKTHTLTLALSGSAASFQGPKLWRLPKELLESPKVRNMIQFRSAELLEEIVAAPNCNVGARWYGWLKRMKTDLRQLHHNRLEALQAELRPLRLAWLSAKALADAGLGDADTASTAKQAYDDANAELLQFKSDCGYDWMASQHEAATSYFLRKPAALKIPIATARSPDGTVVTEPTQVTEIFTAHWRSIMRAEPDPEQPPRPNRRTRRQECRVVAACVRKLSPEQRAALDQELDPAELCNALKSMNAKKSPGPDGWPAGFFQVAPETFAAILCRVFQYQLGRGELLHHQRRSAVVLLYKKGDRSLPGNYRPIALMPVEVKVLSKVLAHRLAGVAPALVHKSQAGFVRGRKLSDQVLTIKALQHALTAANADGFATFLDLEKAYDRVSQPFLFDVLDKMNFGPTFLAWVRLLYKLPRVQLLFQGTLGPTIRPNRGVKQGCPLSCLLFVLYMEPLGDLLRARPDLGIPTPTGGRLTSLFFADDSTLLSESWAGTHAQLAIVREFCEASGAALNVGKCQTLYLNNKRDPPPDPEGVLKTSAPAEPVRYLGIHVGHCVSDDHQAELIDTKFTSSFIQWGWRGRTLAGRKIVASSMLLSQLWHVTMVTTISKQRLAKWQKLVSGYVLGRRTFLDSKFRPWLHHTWHHDKQLGLGLPHIASSIRGQRLRLLQYYMRTRGTSNEPMWAQYVSLQFQHSMVRLWRDSHPFDFLCYEPNNTSSWLHLHHLEPLWHDVWKQWAAVPMAKRMPLPLDLAHTLHAPMWLTRVPALLVDGLSAAARLANAPMGRTWCQEGVANGLWCLNDMLHTEYGWLSWVAFLSRIHNGEHVTRVVYDRLNDCIRIVDPERIRPVYHHFVALLEQLRRTHVRPGAALAPAPWRSHPFRRQPDSGGPVPFEYWAPIHVRRMAYHAPSPEFGRCHPSSTESRTSLAQAKSYMTMFQSALRWAPPIATDVWFRITLNMIPANSRLYWLQERQPDALLCPLSCRAIETPEHAFMECQHIAPIWLEHHRAWNQVGVQLSWNWVLHIDKFSVYDALHHDQDHVFRLWILLVTETLAMIWRHRNAVKWQHRDRTPAEGLVEAAYLRWTAAIRWTCRKMEPDDPERASLLRAAAFLLELPLYRDLGNKYPASLRLLPTFTPG